jgi:hypothetical protein
VSVDPVSANNASFAEQPVISATATNARGRILFKRVIIFLSYKDVALAAGWIY